MLDYTGKIETHLKLYKTCPDMQGKSQALQEVLYFVGMQFRELVLEIENDMVDEVSGMQQTIDDLEYELQTLQKERG